ncbi:MAG: hypothetical protein EZS28_020956 [Streblomastix strix]|uniref:Uncharacterized protein n=1 Tax=Streblomastix strix TaxID=222440 RepID=A0A5J4VLP3_9EUKA|nr:MAG: hypothetical protein EZS28_020956 [Streblomastix strix]
MYGDEIKESIIEKSKLNQEQANQWGTICKTKLTLKKTKEDEKTKRKQSDGENQTSQDNDQLLKLLIYKLYEKKDCQTLDPALSEELDPNSINDSFTMNGNENEENDEDNEERFITPQSAVCLLDDNQKEQQDEIMSRRFCVKDSFSTSNRGWVRTHFFRSEKSIGNVQAPYVFVNSMLPSRLITHFTRKRKREEC